MDRSQFTELDTESLVDFIMNEVSDRAAEVCREGYLDGSSFLMLSQSDIRENFSVLGDRLKITKLLEKLNGEQPAVRQIAIHAQPAQESSNPLWLKSFRPDSVYSTKTMELLEGKTAIITDSIRYEIEDALYHKVLQHEQRPTSEDYSAVCDSLVTMFPCLEDSGDCKYATWKVALRWKFKNGRRSGIKKHADEGDNERPKKRRKRDPEKDCLGEEEFDEKLILLKKEMKSKHPSKKIVRELLVDTLPNRRQWIVKKNPHVVEIVEEYPCFRMPQWIFWEFKYLIKKESIRGLLESWDDLKNRCLKYMYAKIEDSKCPKLKRILSDMETEKLSYPSLEEDIEDFYYVRIITEMLAPKAATCIQVTFPDDTDMTEIIEQVNQSEPYFIRLTNTESMQYAVVAEEEVLLSEIDDVQTAMLAVFACYYAFDIKYPRFLSCSLKFFQHFVFNIECQQKLPTSIVTFRDNLRKV